MYILYACMRVSDDLRIVLTEEIHRLKKQNGFRIVNIHTNLYTYMPNRKTLNNPCSRGEVHPKVS